MKYILVISGIIIITFFGCKQEKSLTDESARIIDKDTMINLMADLEIIESAIKLKQVQLQRDSLEKLSNMAFDSLYIHYKITPGQFKYNLQFYQKDMMKYQEMLDQMIIVLSKKKDSISVVMELEPTNGDTINRIER